MTPTMYLDFTLKPESHLLQPIPESWNAFIYVLEGEGVFGSRSSSAAAHHLLLLGPGNGVEAWNKSSKPLRFILVGGEPLGEPVVQFGPFVMNTKKRLTKQSMILRLVLMVLRMQSNGDHKRQLLLVYS
ncbi:hypothetical protein Ancab_025059 [Ancistrocladus abbreviatus]